MTSVRVSARSLPPPHRPLPFPLPLPLPASPFPRPPPSPSPSPYPLSLNPPEPDGSDAWWLRVDKARQRTEDQLRTVIQQRLRHAVSPSRR